MPNYDHIDHRLHDALVDLLFDSGPQDIDWLTRRARRDLRDARVDEEAVIRTIEVSTLLVPRPDGVVVHALSVLEGNVLTHRVRAPLAGRRDLWLGPGLQPLLNIAAFRPVPLADGMETVSFSITDMPYALRGVNLRRRRGAGRRARSCGTSSSHPG